MMVLRPLLKAIMNDSYIEQQKLYDSLPSPEEYMNKIKSDLDQRENNENIKQA